MERSIQALKARLRADCLARRSRLDRDELSAASGVIRERLMRSAVYANAKVVHTYVSLAGEVDTTELISSMLESGRRVVVPVVEGSSMQHAELRGLEELHPGPMEMRQPALRQADRVEDLTILDLIVVPGLAFDSGGWRLGFGRGYYDRFLSEVGATTVGLTLESFLLDAVPVEDHDVPVQTVQTEFHVYRG